MNTDDFVTLLATGAQPIEVGATRRRYALALGWGGLGAVVLMALLLGVRKDLAQAIYLPMFWIKLAFPLCLAGAALFATMRLSRPGVRLGRVPLALVAPVAVIWLMAAMALLSTAPDDRLALLLGQTWAVCPLLITMLSVPTFIGTFWAIKGLAPTRPALAGAAAGLLASAVATAVYALHCPEMAAPFLATWYLLGMLVPTAAGGLLGARWLRW
jgi:hypothetical protein